MSNDNVNMYGSYNADAVVVSDEVERHRRNPAQYLGASNKNGIRNQTIEFMFNALDETVEAHADINKRIVEKLGPNSGIIVPPLIVDLMIHEDNVVTIRDMGRGMPCGIHKATGEPAVFSLMENDSAGAKGNFSDTGYSSEGTSGMHGAGAAVSKSCTEFLDLEVKEGNSGNKYNIRYIRGYREKALGENGLFFSGTLGPHPYPDLAKLGFLDTGTTITYKYDDTVFESSINGLVSEPYDKDELIGIIRMYLLGLRNKDVMLVRFTYKGEEIMISPHDFTPEKYLGVEPGSPDLFVMDVGKTSKIKGDKTAFSGKLYIKFDAGSYGFSIKTVVNKLEQRITNHDDKIEIALNKAFRTIIKEWVKQNPNKEYEVPSGHMFRPANKFDAIFILDLPVAEFGGQTKDRLQSDAFTGLLGYQVENNVKNNIDKMQAPIRYFQEEVIEHTRYVKNKKKEEIKAQAKIERSKREEHEEKYVESMANDLVARLGAEEKGQFSLSVKRPSRIIYDKCAVCFFEGDSANITVNSAIDSGMQIVSVVTNGKLPNIHKSPDKISDQRIRQMRIHIFSKEFDRYYIFMDPDADGNHIRTQLTKIIQKYRPDMLEQGRVYVVRAPYGMVHNGTGAPVELDTLLEGKRTLPTGDSFVLSFDEMEQAIEKGVRKIDTFRGALEVFTQHQDKLPFEKMIVDPLYLVKIQPPTTRDYEMLDDVLSTKSVVRSSVTRKMYTKRQQYSKYIAKQATGNKLGIKVKDMSRPTVCIVTDTPNVQDVYKFGLPDFTTK